jgi:hypothetical protein
VETTSWPADFIASTVSRISKASSVVIPSSRSVPPGTVSVPTRRSSKRQTSQLTLNQGKREHRFRPRANESRNRFADAYAV